MLGIEDSIKLLADVVCFAEFVNGAVWAEQHALDFRTDHSAGNQIYQS